MKRISVITRTTNADYFKICRESFEQQSWENKKHIVGSDKPCSYFPAIPLTLENDPPKDLPQGMYYAPWNVHLDTLSKYVDYGWLMYLDCDDRFTRPDALEIIMNSHRNDDELLIWKVRIKPDWIVPSEENFGKRIVPGDVSGIGFAFNVKQIKGITWGNLSYGDYRVILQLGMKGLKVRWIDEILTETIAGPHNGKV